MDLAGSNIFRKWRKASFRSAISQVVVLFVSSDVSVSRLACIQYYEGVKGIRHARRGGGVRCFRKLWCGVFLFLVRRETGGLCCAMCKMCVCMTVCGEFVVRVIKAVFCFFIDDENGGLRLAFPKAIQT